MNLKIHHVHHFVSIFCWRLIDLLGFRFSFCSLKEIFGDLEGILWMTGEGRSCRSFSVATAPGPSALCWPATPQVPWLGDTNLIKFDMGFFLPNCHIYIYHIISLCSKKKLHFPNHH